MPSKTSSDQTPSTKPSSIPFSIPPSAMPLISSTALLRAHLQQDPPTRPSGRTPSQPQQIDLNTGSLTHTNGSSVVKIGATTIVCGVRAEILLVSDIPSYDARLADSNTSHPISPETPTPISLYNLLVPNLELNTGCSALHPANAPPSLQAQSLSQRLFTLLLTTNLVSSSDLAISYTPPSSDTTDLNPDDPAYIAQDPEIKAFWTLYIDMICLSYGGEASVFDAAWLSLHAALKDTLLPKVWWDADQKIVLGDPDKNLGGKLNMEGYPVPLGFGVVRSKGKEERKWVIVDPDAFEEGCCDETGCVIVDLTGMEKERGNGKAKIVRVEKSGGGTVEIKELKELLLLAEERWGEWNTVLQGAGIER